MLPQRGSYAATKGLICRLICCHEGAYMPAYMLPQRGLYAGLYAATKGLICQRMCCHKGGVGILLPASKVWLRCVGQVRVYPENAESNPIVLNPKELRIETMRSQGAGGQVALRLVDSGDFGLTGRLWVDRTALG